MMGGNTPNINRIAKEGALFTDYYAQQSCTAVRAAFIPGQSPFRTGLLKVGLPGAKQGIQPSDPTIAELLKKVSFTDSLMQKDAIDNMPLYFEQIYRCKLRHYITNLILAASCRNGPWIRIMPPIRQKIIFFS
jgi:hypothetical protein